MPSALLCDLKPLYMLFSNSEDPYKMSPNAKFHHCLHCHCLLGQNQSTVVDIQRFEEIRTH